MDSEDKKVEPSAQATDHSIAIGKFSANGNTGTISITNVIREPKLELSKYHKTEDFEPETIYVAEGTFLMGSPDGKGFPTYEYQQHEVRIDAYRIGQYPVTNTEYEPGNDVLLDMPNVSRFHAQVTRVGRRYYITDLRSANGTFVNDQRIEGDVWLNPDDTIRIGPYKFVVGDQQFTRYDETEGLRVEAYHLNKWVRKDLNLLQDISLIYQPREFIVVVGQSGGGKSTLVDSIAGYRPASHGKVLVNDIDVYQNFDAIRNGIGYVPQKDIIHMELTIYQALDFAAQLRMPKDRKALGR